MRGVRFVTNENNERVAIQIDLEVLQKYSEDFEDFLDSILALSRKEDEKIPLQTVIQNLKKAGKLQ